MIDNIKFRIEDKEGFEKNIIQKELIVLNSTIEYASGIKSDYPKNGKFHNLQINITADAAYIKGSIHKFYNHLGGYENVNHDDFSLENCIKSIDYLCDYFHINKKETVFTNLEFGFNLNTLYPVSEVIKNNIILWNFDTHNKRQKYKSRGISKEFGINDYRIKIYDKGEEAKLKNDKLMRIELKITSKRVLKRLRVNNVTDININAFKRLYKEFNKQFEKLLIVDSMEPSKTLEMHDAIYFSNYTKSSTWETNKRTKTMYERIKDKKKLLKMIDQQGYSKIKNSLTKLINEKFCCLCK
jgi:hypothetical protein